MLNITFPKDAQKKLIGTYIASPDIAQATLAGNEAFDTGDERRLQSVYGDEIFLKLSRAGFSPKNLNGKCILEVCAGTGFISYHLLKYVEPQKLVLNDISSIELESAKKLIGKSYLKPTGIEWIQGDMFTTDFGDNFDVIIGNSFLHHFYDVPKLLGRFVNLLKPGGVFISLHEPTPMSTVVESAKGFAWLPAVIMPNLINDVARKRYKGPPNPTDIWMFEADKIRHVALKSGFSEVKTIPWGLIRALAVSTKKMRLQNDKFILTGQEVRQLKQAIKIDSFLNRILPHRCFGSLCLVCRR